MKIKYGAVPVLVGLEAATLPQLDGTLIVLNGVTCIQKPNGKIASLNPFAVWEERDPSQIHSPAANFWEHCPPDPDLNVLVFRPGAGLAYKVAYVLVS